MDTSKYLPLTCISPNILECRKAPGIPGIYGTGFFCKLPPHKDVFYVTARHCVEAVLKQENDTKLTISVDGTSTKAVKFDCTLTPITEETEPADITIFVVSQNMPQKELATLRNRAVSLFNPIIVNHILERGVKEKEKIRTIGYPIHDHHQCQTKVDYEAGRIIAQPRSFNGTLSNDNLIKNHYKIIDTNWKEGDYRGFSGSPVIALIPTEDTKETVLAIPTGVIMMASGKTARFININIVRDSILFYIEARL